MINQNLYLTIFKTRDRKVVQVEGKKKNNTRDFFGYTTMRTALKMLKKKNVFIEKERAEDKFVYPDKYRYIVLNRLRDNFLVV